MVVILFRTSKIRISFLDLEMKIGHKNYTDNYKATINNIVCIYDGFN
ncbi:MAG: hypothetical protein ACOVNP_01815 [Flavobacterium sp.]